MLSLTMLRKPHSAEVQTWDSHMPTPTSMGLCSGPLNGLLGPPRVLGGIATYTWKPEECTVLRGTLGLSVPQPLGGVVVVKPGPDSADGVVS